jgi:putative tryptophan/tyrosine transport system substrate-binding protein
VIRREFITLVGGAAAWPLAAWAQQSATPVIGLLNSTSAVARAHLVTAFRQGVFETGYVQDQNVTMEYRWAQDQYDRLPDLLSDLIRLKVAVIAATDPPSALAAKAANTNIPIVFATGGDPVKDGLVASLNRPGGNITGVSFMVMELGAKRLGLIHELLPGAVRLAVLVDPNFPISGLFVSNMRTAASTIGKQIDVLNASTVREIDSVFANLAQKPVDALMFGPSAFFNNHRVELVTFATSHRVPAIYTLREFVTAGGLMSYGTSLTDAHRQAGIYAGRILKGEKPADLPVVQSTKFEFVINLNTAKALGLSFPPGLLAIADEVIE